ncbi:hypothetical protein B0H17DRAFT_1142217 [Mycena rosella]|uniref:Uncharacterized protein n=1 Tax=Mycena rosella TaxID=1033263 RepID=A0AAD7CXJ9_MYCRO|nr:hypothetical protein B0H17DRAFT_1142217 [Mycena rosella]
MYPVPTRRGDHRILRASPSLSSLASSLSSLYTTTSSRTQWGPGSLAGKAILALGKATIRGAERVVIFRRMATIRAHLPCRDERTGSHARFMDEIFDDLLELSRPEVYPDGIRQAAMELILPQIASGHTAYLINSVSKWLLDDVILLVTEIMLVCMFCGYGFPERALMGAYVSALPEGRNPLGPGISFISELAQQNETTYEAVILSKFLDMILLSASQHFSGRRRDFDAETARSFHSAFAAISAPPLKSYEFWLSNLDQYWPFAHHPSLEDVMRHISKTSPATWLLLEAHFLEREAPRMLELATPGKYPMYSGRSVADVTYPRLKDFTLSQASPPFQLQEVLNSGLESSRALWHFLRCVALGGDVHGLMAEHLIGQSHRSKVSMFSRIIYLLIPNTQESRSKEMRDLCSLLGGQQRLTTLLSKFLLDLAHSDDPTRYALLDGVITIVIPLLTEDLDSTAIYETCIAGATSSRRSSANLPTPRQH